MICWLVWTRALDDSVWDGAQRRVAWHDPITYRDWPTVMADVKAALAHGRQVRLSRVNVPLATWRKYAPPSQDQVRRLRGDRP